MQIMIIGFVFTSFLYCSLVYVLDKFYAANAKTAIKILNLQMVKTVNTMTPKTRVCSQKIYTPVRKIVS